MSRRDLPPGTVLLGAKAEDTYTDQDMEIKFFFLQKDFTSDQFMCVIQNGQNAKALGFIMLRSEIADFLATIKSTSERNKRLEYIRAFVDAHLPQRPVTVVQGRYTLGVWEYPNSQ
jgi:hypothetical protein